MIHDQDQNIKIWFSFRHAVSEIRKFLQDNESNRERTRKREPSPPRAVTDRSLAEVYDEAPYKLRE